MKCIFNRLALLLTGILIATPASPAPVPPVVEAEEEVYRFEPANNGAGPMWCHGSTCLVRSGQLVVASGLETLPNKSLNNCRWMLFSRDNTGWKNIAVDPKGRTREPSPLAVFDDGRFFLSVNPTLVTDTNAYGGPAQPEILQFSTAQLTQPAKSLLPAWKDSPQFTEHSYRSFAADGRGHELLLLQNIGYTHAEWAFRDREGNWSASGQLKWPWGAEYEKPQPIRVCYPNVALHNRAVYFCGVSDIVEPKSAWRAYKKELTGREWDYDFRRLFYTWTPDITSQPFKDWVEIASREETCGWISPGDLWVGPTAVHLLWTERALDTQLRQKFFPTARQSHALNYAQVLNGKVILRKTLHQCTEDGPQEIPGQARFHPTPDGKLFVVFYVSGKDKTGRNISEDRILQLGTDGAVLQTTALPLKAPFTSFFTATPRAGSAPSFTLDLLGQTSGGGNTIRYARVRFN